MIHLGADALVRSAKLRSCPTLLASTRVEQGFELFKTAGLAGDLSG
jgi:hypothetical protein